jgi:hypothetical protein
MHWIFVELALATEIHAGRKVVISVGATLL